MKKNLKSDQRKFYTKVRSILAEYGEVKTEWDSLELITDTPFGKLKVTVYEDQDVLWFVAMRFLEHDKFNPRDFILCFGSDFNPYSLKWNIHAMDPDYAISELEERLSNLKWLMDPENFNIVK